MPTFTTYSDADAYCYRANVLHGCGAYSVRKIGGNWAVDARFCGLPAFPVERAAR